MENKLQHSTIIISYNRRPEFFALLDKLNGKAEKFGLDPIRILNKYDVDYTIKLTEDEYKSTCELVKATKKDYIQKTNIVKCTHFECEYPVLKNGDWSVIGKVENMGAKNLLLSLTDDTSDKRVLADYVVHDIQCDHCQLKRNRLESFIVRNNGTNEYKEVGTSCLEEYTGIDPAKALFLTKMFSSVKNSAEDMDHYAGGANSIGTIDFIRNVIFLSNLNSGFGFVSSSKAKDTGLQPTYSAALDLDDLFLYSQSALEEYQNKFDTNTAMAQAILQYYADLVIDVTMPVTEYMFKHNVKLLLHGESLLLEPKYLAFAAAAVPQYIQHLTHNKEKETIGDSFLGNEKEKFKTAMQFIKLTPYEGYYGVGHMLDFRDNQNNKITWFTANKPDGFNTDSLKSCFECVFTVKQHTTYKDIKQTQIVRLKVLNTLTDAEFHAYDQAGKVEDKPKKKPKVS